MAINRIGGLTIVIEVPSLPPSFPINAQAFVRWKDPERLDMVEQQVSVTVPVSAGNTTLSQLYAAIRAAVETKFTAAGHTTTVGAI